MADDKVPVPLQAISAVLIPGLFAAGFFLALVIATSSEPEPGTSRSGWLLLIPVALIAVGGFVQYRFVQRAMVTGMIDSAASPLVVTLLTIAGAVAAILAFFYLPRGEAGVRTPWNRNSISFNGFVGLMLIWLSACAGIMLSRRSRG